MNNSSPFHNSFPRVIQTAILKSGDDEIMCMHQEFRAGRLSVESPVYVPGQAAVSVEHDDAMYLGEVVRTAEVNGRWQLEIQVEQVLSGLTSLLALRNSLLCERPAPHAVAEAVR